METMPDTSSTTADAQPSPLSDSLTQGAPAQFACNTVTSDGALADTIAGGTLDTVAPYQHMGPPSSEGAASTTLPVAGSDNDATVYCHNGKAAPFDAPSPPGAIHPSSAAPAVAGPKPPKGPKQLLGEFYQRHKGMRTYSYSRDKEGPPEQQWTCVMELSGGRVGDEKWLPSFNSQVSPEWLPRASAGGDHEDYQRPSCTMGWLLSCGRDILVVT